MTTIGSVLLTMWTSCMLPAEASLPADTLRTARQLQQVDVRAGRTTAEEYVGSPTQRMDARTLQERGVSSLTDALQRFSGTNVRDYGGAGGLKTVSVHGMGAGHTVVTLNGLSLGDHRSGQVDLARYNDVSALTEVSLTTADQLSLLCPVRNLGGALLNLQTDATPDSAGHHVKAAVSGGSFGTVSPSLDYQARQARGAGTPADNIISDRTTIRLPYTTGGYRAAPPAQQRPAGMDPQRRYAMAQPAERHA